jgi:cytochrome P450
MEPLILTALVAAALAALAVARARIRGGVPQPWSLPWWGETSAALADPAALRERLHARHGPVYASVFLGNRYVAVRGFDDVRALLNGEHALVETEWPAPIRRLLGPGSVSTTHFGAHKKLRAALAPVFAPRAVAASLPRVAAILAKHFDRWVAQGPGLRGAAAVKAATFEVIVDVGMGFPPDWSTPANLALFTSLFDTWLGGFAPGASSLPGGKLAKGLAARREMIRIIDGVVAPAVAARRAVPLPDRAPPASTLDRLADAVDEDGKELPVGTLSTVALNVLFAGHETSSQILTLLLRTLHPNAAGTTRPDLLDALRAEQAAVVAAHGDEITQASLDAAPLAAACVKEQLRLTPVVSQVFRRTLVPIPLNKGACVVPAGEVVVLDLEHTIAADARWAGEPPASPLHPSRFEPTRWTEGGLAARKEGGWLPFGGGARYCVGWALATAELGAALALLARTYEWSLHNPEAGVGVPPAPRAPKDGLVMTVRRASEE